METPVPNFYFMGVQFIHLLALSIWVGGVLILQVLVIPSLFRIEDSQQSLPDLLASILQRFNQITLLCTLALISTSIIKFWSWENLTPWNLIRYIAITLMSVISFYAYSKVSPQLKQFFTVRPPQEIRLNHPLYQQSSYLMRLSLSCGLTALLMA